jgi:hypothetical protein
MLRFHVMTWPPAARLGLESGACAQDQRPGDGGIERYRAGTWPPTKTVILRFGSWRGANDVATARRAAQGAHARQPAGRA